MCSQFSVGVSWCSRVMVPIVNRRRAGVRQLDRCQENARVKVVGRIEGGGREFCGEIGKALFSRRKAATDRAPHVIVCVDEARHDDHICRVDYLCSRRGDPSADALDHPISNQDICTRQSPLRWIYGYYGSIVDQICTALDLRRHTLSRRSSNQSWSGKRCEGCDTSQFREISPFHFILRFLFSRSSVSFSSMPSLPSPAPRSI